MHSALATAAALVSMAFGLSTLERWLDRRRPHELAWTVALAMFSAASFAMAAGASLGWSGPTFKAFYLFGAILNVPFLALGTVYLHAGRRTGDRCAVVVALLAAFATGVVVAAPFTAEVPRHELVRGSEVFGPLPRVLAAVGSGAGALVIFAGALVSAWRFRRGRMLWANVLIATGTVVLSSSGLLNSVLDEMDAFAVTLVAGISLIFGGFLLAVGAGASGRSPDGARDGRALTGFEGRRDPPRSGHEGPPAPGEQPAGHAEAQPPLGAGR